MGIGAIRATAAGQEAGRRIVGWALTTSLDRARWPAHRAAVRRQGRGPGPIPTAPSGSTTWWPSARPRSQRGIAPPKPGWTSAACARGRPRRAPSARRSSAWARRSSRWWSTRRTRRRPRTATRPPVSMAWRWRRRTSTPRRRAGPAAGRGARRRAAGPADRDGPPRGGAGPGRRVHVACSPGRRVGPHLVQHHPPADLHRPVSNGQHLDLRAPALVDGERPSYQRAQAHRRSARRLVLGDAQAARERPARARWRRPATRRHRRGRGPPGGPSSASTSAGDSSSTHSIGGAHSGLPVTYAQSPFTRAATRPAGGLSSVTAIPSSRQQPSGAHQSDGRRTASPRPG